MRFELDDYTTRAGKIRARYTVTPQQLNQLAGADSEPLFRQVKGSAFRFTQPGLAWCANSYAVGREQLAGLVAKAAGVSALHVDIQYHVAIAAFDVRIIHSVDKGTTPKQWITADWEGPTCAE